MGLWVSDRGREAATTEATCLLRLEASEVRLELDRGRENFSEASVALRLLLCDLKLDGVGGRIPLPVKDLGPKRMTLITKG